ncbi:methyltransferase domain-containing protein [Paracoccus pacificus]|uniref:Methyltransferase domain-containing protein n=1 Tax=Paracoccus pacificus TaxID=1463598 RepID=A0ABW4R7L9_9RHOB
MTGYHDGFNPDLLALMPLSARRVLEIGCGSGVLARVWRQRNPAAHYTAVEIHAESAARAARHVDRLIEGDIEVLADADLGGPFDLVVMGDSLEHLADADRMLARIKGLLVPGGVLLASVPNIAHWSALRVLLEGRWPNTDDGLFDRTHRRFFTFSALSAALQKAGLRMLKSRARNLPATLPPEAADTIEALAGAAKALGLDDTAFRARARALQYVVCAENPPAQPRPVMRLHSVAMVPAMMAARTLVPDAALRAEPGIALTTARKIFGLPGAPPASHGRDTSKDDGPRVAVVQRLRFESEDEAVRAMARAHGSGWAVVIEYDDHPALLDRVLQRDASGVYRKLMGMALGVQTSTPKLADVFRELNPNVAVFPNAVLELPEMRPLRPGPAQVFMGALNRGPVAAEIARALAPAITAHPDTHFHVVHDRDFFDNLPTDRKTFHGTLGYDDYLARMAACDIALMPLEGRPDELFKSDLKWVEASSRGLANIASPAVYGDTVRHGENGLIAAAPVGWGEELRALLDQPDRRHAIATRARAEVAAGRMMAHQVTERHDWYRQVWAGRETLLEAALKRHPDLRRALADVVRNKDGSQIGDG